jgi:molybdopterin synthase catalytic subunit
VSALSPEPLETAALLALTADPEHGGTALFVGTTRREAARREVSAIEYQAHEQLAEREISLIADEVRARFGATAAARHRLGRVSVGEPSVVVVASAAHRREAFGACRYAIDQLKLRAPIWKRVHYADGATEWIDGTGRAG